MNKASAKSETNNNKKTGWKGFVDLSVIPSHLNKNPEQNSHKPNSLNSRISFCNSISYTALLVKSQRAKNAKATNKLQERCTFLLTIFQTLPVLN